MDVGGLHAKLQRVQAVEQHNTTAQGRFAQRMEQSCSSMQSALQEHSLKHAAMLDHYRRAMGEFMTLLGLGTDLYYCYTVEKMFLLWLRGQG